MSETDEFSQPTHDGERGVFALEAEQTADQRQIESQRTKLGVLIGSGILQLPIWGMPAQIISWDFISLCSNMMYRVCDELWRVPAILL